MMVGIDLQAALKKSKTRRRASVRFAEFGGTPIFLNVKGAAIFIFESRIFSSWDKKGLREEMRKTQKRFEKETSDYLIASTII